LADDIHALARPHAAEAIAGLVEFMRQREDCHLAMSAMIALLDRGYGRPPQALLAQVGGTSEPVRYEFYWADAKTNKAPEDKPATIDATATTNAEGEAETEAQGVALYWADGTRAG
jgi:hypothetical protein